MLKLKVSLLVLTVAAIAIPGAALAQDVSQTYPMTISSPAFGPGVRQPVARHWETPSYRRREIFAAADMTAARGSAMPEVWQTYPMTISTPAFGRH